MNIPEVVKQYVLDACGRMPETQEEVDQYLDLINHGKKYADAVILSKKFSRSFMKRYGIKTPEEVKKEGI